MSGILSYHNDWVAGPQKATAELGGAPEQTYNAVSSPWHMPGVKAGMMTAQQMFDFARFLWKQDPTFQQAIKRVIGYFLTDVEYYDPTHKAELKEEDIVSYRQVLEDQLNIKFALHQILQNYCLYGNVILSLLPPMERRLTCPNVKCRMVHPLAVVASAENNGFKFEYHAKGVRFEATCLVCNARGNWGVFDVPANYRRNVCLTIYNPYHFTVECDQFSDRRLYTWNIPSDLKSAVKAGNPLRLLHTPLSVLEAIGEDKPFLFNDGILLHLREPDVVGFDMGGWGTPQAMYCYRTSRYVFGLRRMNEVLASDYMIPMRLFSPTQQQQAGRGFVESGTMDMADFTRLMRSAIANHKKNPESHHIVPQPVEYQVVGTPGKDLAPGELLIQGEDMQLNAYGMPPQFYRGDLTLQAAPMAARLFEAHWQHVPDAANTALAWIIAKITPHLSWKEFGARLTPPKIADNLDQLMLLLQLQQMGEVSATTLLPKVGLMRAEEQRRLSSEAVQSAKLEVETQKDMDKIVAGNDAINQAVQEQQAMMMEGGGMPLGGIPPMGAEGAPAADPVAQIMARIQAFPSDQTPIPITEILQLAQEAAIIFAGLPEMQKRQKLREIDMINKPLADLIRKQLEEVRKQSDRDHIIQGRAMVEQGGGMPVM